MVDPIAFSLLGRPIYWYGLIIGGAILLALPLTIRRATARGISAAQVETSFWWMIVGGIVGARLIYVLQNTPYYIAHVGEVIAVWDGGLAIHGAILGGALALAISVRFSRQQFWAIADAAVPGLLLGMILGRFGNFANHELFGPPTSVAWKMFIPLEARPVGMEAVAYYHPTFLYDALLNTIVLVLLLRYGQRFQQPGQLTLWFFLGIALTRFTVEFWRLGETAWLGLSPAQLVSLLLAGIAVTLLWLMSQRRLTLAR